jgi:MOSC domain-containing protein YiiM
MGSLKAIWIKRLKGGPMDPVERAALVAGRGIVGNANQGGQRQVTILSEAEWDAVTAPVGGAVDPKLRRANLMVADLDLADARNKVLQIGGVRIRILGETRPCEQMERARPGLQAAMAHPWGGGAYGEVLDDGVISVGDQVTFVESS